MEIETESEEFGESVDLKMRGGGRRRRRDGRVYLSTSEIMIKFSPA